MILLQFNYKGTVELICDRCLDPFDMDISGDENVVLKFGKNAGRKKTEEEFIPFDQQELDIRQYLYDFISLNIPFRKVHPDDENGNSLCDRETIEMINKLSNTKNTDPRWDQLKDIQIN